MGYRERRAHKSQQKQQQFGKSQTGQQLISIYPGIDGHNYRDHTAKIAPTEARYIDSGRPTEYGLQFEREPRLCALTSAGAGSYGTLISYAASGSASAEMWGLVSSSAGVVMYNFGEVIDANVTATASGVVTSGSAVGGDYTVFNHTVIFVNNQSDPLKWTRASGWEEWSATISAGDISQVNGITDFKSRIFLWNTDDTKFWYGSTDQVLGTFNSFDLDTVVNGNIQIGTSFTRDGGAGPDDYMCFITDQGEVATYAGTDPGDASTWSLVGVYKIGKPVSQRAFASYGQQVVVLCEDDFYFLPLDFQGKREPTKGVHRTSPDPIDALNGTVTNGVVWEEKGLMCFSDCSLISLKQNYKFSTFRIADARVAPHVIQDANNVSNRASLAVYKGKLYGLDLNGRVMEMMPEKAPSADIGLPQYNGKLITGEIELPARTDIALVNPVFKVKTDNTSASAPANIKYRTAVVYDQDHKWKLDAASADGVWVTSSASTDSQGLWVPGFGTGYKPAIHIELLSASTSGELFLKRIDITVESTGGI